MSVAHVLVILTLLADGQMSAAFVNTESAAACEARAGSVGAVLRQGGADVKQLRCIPSELRFVRFSHAKAQSAPRHAYELVLGEASLALNPQTSVAECEAFLRRADAPSEVERVCVPATQSLEMP